MPEDNSSVDQEKKTKHVQSLPPRPYALCIQLFTDHIHESINTQNTRTRRPSLHIAYSRITAFVATFVNG